MSKEIEKILDDWWKMIHEWSNAKTQESADKLLIEHRKVATKQIKDLILEARIEELERMTDNDTTWVVSDIQDIKDRINELKQQLNSNK